MGARTKARKSALDVLYAAEVRGVSARSVLNEPSFSGNELRPYTVLLVEGVADHAVVIDELISRYSREWEIDRMPAIDRNLLRIAVFEIGSGQVDGPVAVDEAVSLAKQLSTDDSPNFVNGVLGALIATEPREALDADFADVETPTDVNLDDEESGDEAALDADFSQPEDVGDETVSPE